MIEVRRCTMAELHAAPNIAELLAEYAAESSIEELGATPVYGDDRARAQAQTYRTLEANGTLRPVGAFKDGMLIGFILPLVAVLPHYGEYAATVESFFVAKAERSSAVGLKLLGFAENMVRDMGAKGLLLIAPLGGALDVVLSHTPAFRHSNNVYVKQL